MSFQTHSNDIENKNTKTRQSYDKVKLITMLYTESDFEDIYNATVTRLSKHVFFKVQNLEDAQDLVQDLYLELYKHLQRCTERLDNPQAYLIQMANHALTRYYQDKLRRPVTLMDETTDPFITIPDKNNLEAEVLEKVTSEALWKTINTLKEPEKSLMIGRFRFDMSYTQLSEALSMPETTIKSKVYKVLSDLQKKFL